MIIKTDGTQKESKVIEVCKKEQLQLHYDIEYDTMKPENTIREFSEKIKSMINRYEGNKAKIFEIENELNDLEHYMEIGNFKNVPEGYRLYRKLAELRRERRACKNENDLLWPIYEHFHATEVLNRLTKVQGECSKLKDTIDSRYYAVRTDVLDEWMKTDKEEPLPKVGLNLLTGETLDMSDENLSNPKSNSSEKSRKYDLVWKEAIG